MMNGAKGFVVAWVFLGALGCTNEHQPKDISAPMTPDVSTDIGTKDVSTNDVSVLDAVSPDALGEDALSEVADDLGGDDIAQTDATDVSIFDVLPEIVDVVPESDAFEDAVDVFEDVLEDASEADILSEVVSDAGAEPMQPWAVMASEQPAPEWAVNTLVEGSYGAAYALPIGTWLEGGEGSQFYDPKDGDLLAITGLEGSVQKVEVLGLETILVLTDEGLYAFNGTMAAPSPLNDAVADPPVLNLVDASSKDVMELWLMTASTLYHWEAGELTAIAIPGVNLSGAEMTYGAHFEGVPACWVATSSDQLFAVQSTDEGVSIWEVLSNAPIDELASDLDGNLWVRQQGDLFRRSPDAQWDWFVFETPLLDLAAHRASWMAWFRLDNALWGHYGGEFWLIQEGPEPSFMMAGMKETLTVVQTDQVAQLVVTSLPDPPAPPTTWSEDVAKLSEQKCGLCHGEGQFAHEMATLEQWVDEFDEILFMVDTGQMPLAPVTPLTPSQVQTLLDWQSGGFQP